MICNRNGCDGDGGAGGAPLLRCEFGGRCGIIEVMKKRCAIVLMMCVAMWVPMARNVAAVEPTQEVQEARFSNIAKNCEKIRESLVNVQHSDSRARVYLGRYYETMLSKFITPLNVWLVGRNKSSAGLIENQNSFAETRGKFVSDYIAYQKELEELVAVNCKAEPEKFDTKLTSVRQARAKVASEVAKLRKLMDEQVKLVTKMKEGL